MSSMLARVEVIIAADRLTRRYPGVTALDELTLEVPPGIVGLVGANGAGKSTLIKILLGLLPATTGGARVLGLDPAREGGRVRALVGYMPEHDCLPPELSATELVVHMARASGLPATAARERAADTLRHVGLYEERYRHIGGYSTGMRQRVKLAQALVHDPRLVLLDEPTNGLDPAGRAEMLALVRRIGIDFGISVLISSHDLGYRRYDGPRLGRWSAARAVYVHSLRGIFGIGRPARAKVLPFLLVAITAAPALVSGALTAVVAVIPPIPYAGYAYYLQIAIMIFLAAQAPQVVTGDIRFRTLSLYFSRPLERS